MASQPILRCLRHSQFENWSSRESNFGESTNSTTVYDMHIFENRLSRRISWLDWTSHPNQPAVTTYIFWRESTIQPIQPAVWTHIFFWKLSFARNYFCEDRRFNQFNQQLRHTYYSKIEFREKLFLRGLAIQPIQPIDATSMFWIEPQDEIVGKEWQVNHINSVCDTHNL